MTDDGGVDGDGDAGRSEASNRAHSARLSTTNWKRAALLALGHRSGDGDDSWRTAGGGYDESSDLGGKEEDREV